MATQSLYRRYRPRRFSEVKGQDHVVRALRNAVAEGREGQAYLFSGPRGTGKTTSARILAKVLNCEQPTDGEPCCECESCRSVERGTSYDVHELDAASNNGVDSMRDLIEKASLGTPGRHKVYILDEVHMLSKGAEATLLKTLEEPPPHVVFVLATTDPQRVSDTIRSRTQHLQFHLLPTDTLAEHVRWVVADAGLTVDDDAIGDVLALGGGSARDTLSALELVASAGGERVETVSYDEFVEAMIDRDPGRALTMVAQAVSLGRDPRTLTEELVGFLRNGFLALMAPELVQLPSDRVEVVADLARRLGPPGLVRGIEVFGTALVEMRQAPEPRVLLEVAVVQLTADSVAVDVTALLTRLDRLERRVDELGRHGEPTAATETGSAAETGPPAARAALGGRARSRPAPSTQPDAGPTTASEAVGSRDHTGTAPAPDGAPERAGPSEAEPATADSDASADSGSAGGPLTRDDWENTIRPQLRGMARAVYAPAEFVSSSDTNVVLSLPDNPMHLKKCEQQRSTVESALAAHTGSAVAVEFVTGDGDGGGGDGDAGGGGDAGDAGSGDDAGGGGGDGGGVASRAMSDGAAISTATPRGAEGARAAPDGSPVDEAPAGRSPTGRTQDQVGGDVAARGPDVTDSTADSTAGPTADSPGAPIRALPEDHEVDLDDLVEAPPESVKTPIDRLAEAFPGSQFIDESA